MKRIFVSSTFVDMNEERDALATIVTPELNKRAKEYGQSVSFCDLRWGIDTSELESEEGARKVLSICLEEIDDCSPYLVVLLGERYGWIPQKELIAQTVETKPEFTLEDLEKSVTALEIEYGALQDKEQLKDTLFYFREIQGMPPQKYCAEDELHSKKLLELKDRIRKVAGDQLKTYTLEWNPDTETLIGIEKFCEMVTEDIHALMEEDWKAEAALPIYEKDYIWQMDYMKQNVRPFSCGQEWMEEYLEKAKDFLKVYYYKTTIVSSLASYVMDQGWNVIPAYCGQTESTTSINDLARYLIYHLEKIQGFEHDESIPDSLERLQERLRFLYVRYAESEQTPLLIVLDDVDLIEVTMQEDILCLIPYHCGDKVRMIATMQSYSHVPYGFNYPLGTQGYLRPSSREVVEFTLKNLHRELNAEVIDAILTAPSAHMFSHLQLLVHRLCMMDSEDYANISSRGEGIAAITEYHKYLVQNAGDYFHLPYQVFYKAAAQMGDTQLYMVLEYIRASSYGLREQDIAALFKRIGKKWNLLDYRRYILYLKSFLHFRRDGRIFLDMNYRSGIVPHFLSHDERHQHLFEYLLELNSDEATDVQELISQCIDCNDTEEFLLYLDRNRQKSKIIDVVAKELRKRTRDGNVGFLPRLFDSAVKMNREELLVWFMNKYGTYMLSRAGRVTHDVNLKCWPRQVEFARKLMEETKNVDTMGTYVKACLLAAKIIGGYGNEQAIEIAKDYYKEGLSVMDEYLGYEVPLRQTVDTLCDYGCYYRMKGTWDYTKEFELYTKALQMATQLMESEEELQNDIDLIYVNVHMGDVYRENRAWTEAIQCYKKAYDKYESMVPGRKNDASLQDALAIASERLFLCYYEELKANKHCLDEKELDKLSELILFYLEKCLAINKELYEQCPSLDRCEQLVFVHEHYARYYILLGGEKNNQKTIQSYESFLQLIKHLLDNGRDAVKFREMAAKAEVSVGDILYSKTFDVEKDTQAIQCYRRAIDHYQYLYKYRRLKRANKGIIRCYKKIAGIFDSYGGTSNLENSLYNYKQALYAAMHQYRDNETTDHKNEVHFVILSLVSNYKKLGKVQAQEAAEEVFDTDNFRAKDFQYIYTSWTESDIPMLEMWKKEFIDWWTGESTFNPFDF